jgi:hypothetical protein
MIQSDTMYDWEKEARYAEIRTEEMFGPEARKQLHKRHGEAGASVTVQVRSLYSPDWSDQHEA